MINKVQMSNSLLLKSSSVNNSQSCKSFDSILQSKVNNKSMDEVFTDAAERYNVPVKILRAVAEAESGFNARAVSSCGAMGVMQLMPETAKSLGVSDPYNAEQNINGGAKFLAALLKKYNGNLDLTLAAYNAGPGNVDKYNGVPPFEETQNYIKKIRSILGNENATVIVSNFNDTDKPAISLKNEYIDEYLSYIKIGMLRQLL